MTTDLASESNMKPAISKNLPTEGALKEAPDKTLALIIMLPTFLFWAILIDLAMRFL
jgi:hypothetical protein